MHDQGTGCVADLAEFGVPGEPTVAGCLRSGADLVTFSADKLFGGPQAGIAAGREEIVRSLTSHPVARVVRPDKLTLAALHATLSGWATGAWREFPIYGAAAVPLDSLDERGREIASQAASPELRLRVVPSAALFGGGTSPEKSFASRALAAEHVRFSADDLAARLREAERPIVARVEESRLLLDLRSVAPGEDPDLIRALRALGNPRA